METCTSWNTKTKMRQGENKTNAMIFQIRTCNCQAPPRNGMTWVCSGSLLALMQYYFTSSHFARPTSLDICFWMFGFWISNCMAEFCWHLGTKSTDTLQRGLRENPKGWFSSHYAKCSSQRWYLSFCRCRCAPPRTLFFVEFHFDILLTVLMIAKNTVLISRETGHETKLQVKTPQLLWEKLKQRIFMTHQNSNSGSSSKSW